MHGETLISGEVFPSISSESVCLLRARNKKKNLFVFLSFNFIPFRVRLSPSVACNVCWLSGSY